MDRYDYYKAVEDDFAEFVAERCSGYIDDDRASDLYDDAFVSDSVTGNASGSHTFSRWKAEECLCHNSDLLKEALDGTCSEYSDPETNDVIVRCHVLSEVSGKVIDAWNEDHPEPQEDGE